MKRTTIALALLALLATLPPAGRAFAAPAVDDITPSAAEAKVPDGQVVRLPVADDPTVSFRILFYAGSQNDPPGKEGLASITGAMLAEASTKQNAYAKILDLLFPLAGGYSASVSTETTVVAGRIHKDNLADYYPLLVAAILQPAFQQDDLDRLKSQAANYLENTLRYAGDEDLAKAVLQNTIYAGTPYGHIPEGTVAGVQSITLDDVRSFYRTYYTRDNLLIGIGGGYDAATLDRLRHDLAALPPGKPPTVPPPEPQPIEGRQVVIVKKDAASTAISLGYPLPLLRGSREWYALAIANSWLGEHRNSSSHLYQVIREARGLNYGDYTYLEYFPNGGELLMPPYNVARRRQLFQMWIRPVPDDARQFALRAALREFEHLIQRGLTPEAFELTRNFLKKYTLHYASTTMDRLGYALDDRFYGIHGSHLELFPRMMSEITLGEVNRAIRKYFQAKNLQIVAVTKDAESFKEALIHDTPSPYTYPTPKPPAILEEDRQISTYPLHIRADAVKIVPVEELFVK